MFFAFFGLGVQELIVLGLLFVLPVVIVAIVLLVNQSSKNSSGRMSALEVENRRLREEIEQNRERPQ